MTGVAQLDPRLSAELAPSVVTVLEEWQAAQGVQLSLDAWMTTGNTRAAVAVVVVTGAGTGARTPNGRSAWVLAGDDRTQRRAGTTPA